VVYNQEFFLLYNQEGTEWEMKVYEQEFLLVYNQERGIGGTKREI